MGQVHLNSMNNAPRIKLCVRIMRNHADAMECDRNNGNPKWGDADKLELNHFYEYESFESLGSNEPSSRGHTKIRCHLIHDANQDGRYKARFVSGCHMTGMNEYTYYSSVVSLQEMQAIQFGDVHR